MAQRASRAPRVPRVRLTGRAARFLQMMQDLGHLDEESKSQVLLSVRVANPSRAPAWVDVDTVRSATAMILFHRLEGEEVSGILSEDWPLVFS
jgi:hypothetical protein